MTALVHHLLNGDIVDRFELGCPYSADPACGSTGCIGASAPTGSGNNGKVYYDRSSGQYYASDRAILNSITGANLTGKLSRVSADANIYVSRLAPLPP